MSIQNRIEKWNKPILIIIGFVLTIGLGLIDYITGYEYSFSLFYLIPISFVVWFTGKRYGIALSVVSALAWLASDYLSGNHYSHPFIFFWNTAIRFGFFIIVTLLMAALHKALEHERHLSRTDGLTGAVSSDFFHVLLQAEINRSMRYSHPYTLAYIDLDNFKKVNDLEGHHMGDKVLSTVVRAIRNEIRKTDIIARLGGDEFAILFLETDTLTAGSIVAKSSAAPCWRNDQMQLVSDFFDWFNNL